MRLNLLSCHNTDNSNYTNKLTQLRRTKLISIPDDLFLEFTNSPKFYILVEGCVLGEWASLSPFNSKVK